MAGYTQNLYGSNKQLYAALTSWHMIASKNIPEITHWIIIII